MEDNGRDAGPLVGKTDPEPVWGVASIDWRRHSAGDIDNLAELTEAIDLVGPDEAEQRWATLVERGIDGAQITAAALDDPDGGWDLQEREFVPPKIETGARADFE